MIWGDNSGGRVQVILTRPRFEGATGELYTFGIGDDISIVRVICLGQAYKLYQLFLSLKGLQVSCME